MFSIHRGDSIPVYTGRIYTSPVRFHIVPDIPMNTMKIQMSPITSGVKLGCGREDWGPVIKVKGVHGGVQASWWEKAETPLFLLRGRETRERVIPAKTWSHHWIISNFCELCLCSLSGHPAAFWAPTPPTLSIRLRASEVEGMDNTWPTELKALALAPIFSPQNSLGIVCLHGHVFSKGLSPVPWNNCSLSHLSSSSPLSLLYLGQF